MSRNQIFISYPHADATRWKDDFLTMLAPAIDRGRINIWSDQAIPVGADWSEHIHAALGSACAGLLLVTPEFFKSEYISAIELAELLNLAKTNGVTIWWVPVAPSLFSTTPLKDIKAAWNPDTPLELLPLPEQKSAIERICTQLVEDFGFLPKVTPDNRTTLAARLQARLGDRYEVGEESGAGRFCIVYSAKQKNPKRNVAVKVFAATEFDEWASRTFQEAVEYGATLSSPAFIKIIEHSTDSPEFLVTELVQGEPLTRNLQRYPTGMPLSLVRRILRDLIIAFEELHAQDRVRGELYPSNVLVQPAGTPRISTVDLAAVVNSESRLAGDFRVDRESLAYMTPERFFGAPHTHLSDQFSLGLIAMEMLGGERVPRVNCPRDLEDKRRLFEDLESGRGRWAERSRDFAGLVSRMLRTDPEGRWPSMSAVRDFMQDIAIAETDEERARKTAKASYLRLQGGGRDRAFFAQFYENLLVSCPDVKRHFAADRMVHQHGMLNRAMQLLLEFDPACGCNQLRELAAGHAKYQLTRWHYDQFVEALIRTIEQSGTADQAELSAWRTTVTPAVDFMRTCHGAAASRPPSPV